MIRPLIGLVLALSLSPAALADQVERPVGPDATAPAEGLPVEGIWTWVRRFDGEPLSDEAREELEARGEEEVALLGGYGEVRGLDIPAGYYDDPTRVLDGDPLMLELLDPAEFDIPLVIDESVESAMRYLLGPGRKHYARWLGRSTRYIPMIQAQLEERGMPRDIVYLSMIESGFSAYAYSSAQAAGLWQFIPSTGRLYKLRVDWWVDDRRDPELATLAALAYLQDLHRMFGDWHLAFASYNGGPGRVRRAQTKSGVQDYWGLARGNWLPRETANYVPMILAAAIIGKHPDRYGFTEIEYEDPLEYEVSPIDGAVELEILARCAGITLEEFQALNPGLRRWAAPKEGYPVRLPKGKAEPFAAALAEIPESERITFLRHQVSRGQTLGGIATEYGVSVSDIVRANQLADANRIYVGMSLIIPVSAAAREGLAAAAEEERSAKPASSSSGTASASSGSGSGGSSSASASTPTATDTRTTTTYTVRKGDTLSEIAARFGVSVDEVRSWNGIRGSTIYAGQRLTVRGGTATAAAPSASGGSSGGSSAAATTTQTHVVARGETLSGIAQSYGVSVSQLQSWNGISNASSIRVGQRLSVRVPESAWTVHTVRSGDNLGSIARHAGCSVDDLMRWNGLSSSVIHPGQTLRIKK